MPNKNDSQKLEEMRHSLAHLLAAAVMELYPDAKRTIGPAIENGFYYDFEFPAPISDSDLPKIEKRMRKILPTWKSFERIDISEQDARKKFVDNPYKLELIDEYAKGGLTMYQSGAFEDLCRGGHSENPAKDIDSDTFKLTHVAGAYWRGNEKNTMLTRIYGLAFATKEELDAYLAMLEEAKKRDHKKLGVELDLFTFSDLVGSGLPLFTPKGTVLRDVLDNFVWQLRKKHGYERVDIPHITKKDLYEKSGHWDKFKDELFKITTREGHLLAMKPMNCPHHTQIYARKQWSYRELPQRYASTTKVYRDEQSGELSGIARVISITQDDAHVFCRISQVQTEIQKIWEIVHTFYGACNMKLRLRLSLRDPAHPEKYLGSKEHWDQAEEILREIARENKTEHIEALGEAAFYAPKLDFMAVDSLGREWQVATIQLDVHMPERFGLYCVNEQGEHERIVMIHAAIMGSIERFLSIIIEHFGGAFPYWLAPVQVKILTVNDTVRNYAEEIIEKLRVADIRAELDDRNESIGKKIREGQMEKVPHLYIIGEKEMGSGTISVRDRSGAEEHDVSLEKFIEAREKEIPWK